MVWRAIIGAMLFAVATIAMGGTVRAQAVHDLGPCAPGAPQSGLLSPYGQAAIHFDCGGDQTRHGPGDYRLRLKAPPLAPLASDPLVLRFASLWQDGLAVRFDYADGSHAVDGFTSATALRYLQIGATFAIPVPHRPAALTGITVQTTGSANLRGLFTGAALMPQSASDAVNRRLIGLYAAFGGLIVSLLVYNLAMWSALRHRFQLIYSLMLAAIGAYTITSSGALAMWLPDIDNNVRLRLNYVLLALGATAALAFIRAFFRRGVIPGWLNRAFDVISIAAVGSAVVFALFAPRAIWLLDRAYFVTLSTMLLALLPLFWFVWVRKSRFRLIFLIAWSAPLLSSAARVLYGFGILPYNFWLDNGNLIALSIEALVNSVLITARLRDLSSERDMAQAGERSALRLANADPLTGLLNRRAFIEQATGRPGLHRLLLVDIDHFKTINDRFGHDAGDQVLVGLAALLQKHRPAGSLAVRLGGEEFALLIPVGREDECRPADLLAAVRGAIMAQRVSITASIGVAEGRLASEEDWKRLYRLADSALYRAKADGRDRFCRATDFSEVAAA